MIEVETTDLVKRMEPLAADSAEGQKRRARIERTLRWVMPFVVVGAWQAVSSLGWLDRRFFPGPSSIWSSGVDLVKNGTLQKAITVTGRRTLWGFFLGGFAGFVLGVALGTSRLLRAAFEPIVYAFWTVPKLALLPLLLLIFGFGDKPVIVLVILNTSFLVMIPTIAAMGAVPEQFRETARSFGVGPWQMFWHVLLPSALPEIFIALRISAGASILVVVASEFVNGSSGLGYLIWNSWTVFLPQPMYVGIVVVAVLGAIFTLAIAGIGRRLAPWSEGL